MAIVITILENIAGKRNIMGSIFEDLRNIIDLVNDKTRVGVCLNTCHAFIVRYDLRSLEAFADTIERFDQTIGLWYLKALYLNDSKTPFNSRKDVYTNIRMGYLRLRAFYNVINYKPF